MPEPITEQNREQATIALLRVASLYRGIITAVASHDPQLITKILDELGEGQGPNGLEMGDAIIKAWADFLEIRDV